MARRTFSLDDQRAFAALSGDWNPAHVDPIAARRTLFGGAVVHGVHLMLWAIDRALATAGDAPCALDELRARFPRPLPIDAEVALEVACDGHELRATARRGTDVVLELSARIAVAVERPWPARRFEERAPEAPSRDAVTALRGELPIAVDRELAAALLPIASARLIDLAELLATTRLVGMICPGLHSLFGGLTLRATPDGPADMLAYEVRGARLAYSLVPIVVRGPRLAGTLDTFYRAPPVAGPSAAEVRARVTAGAYAARTALVVGGSRGIGGTLARALGAGGARVAITYHRGAADAAAVVAEIGDRARAFPLDVTRADAIAAELDARWPFADPPSHLYYCATPPISAHAGLVAGDLARYLAYYVTGLHAVATWASAAPLVLWSPSTIFLDTSEGNAAYAIAKCAMEELCRRLAASLPVVAYVPRLPRIATDQTASLVETVRSDVLDVAIAALNETSPEPSRG